MNNYKAKENFQTWASSQNKNELTEEEASPPTEMTYNMIVSMYDDNTHSSSQRTYDCTIVSPIYWEKGDYLNTLKTPRYMA